MKPLGLIGIALGVLAWFLAVQYQYDAARVAGVAGMVCIVGDMVTGRSATRLIVGAVLVFGGLYATQRFGLMA